MTSIARTITIPNDVLAVLSGMTFDGTLGKLTGQLDRPLYVATNKVLENLGGKWDRKRGGHVFTGEDAAARIDEAILTGSYDREKGPNGFDFFPTPRPLAREVIRLAQLKPGLRVLEPSAGDGALADAALGEVPESSCDVWDFTCYELRSDLRATLARKGYRVAFNPDFMLAIDAATFDRIIMNPPFSKQQDAEHVTKAWQHLAPGGILVAITSAGVNFRTTRKTEELRALIAANSGTITENPAGSFKSSGTMVNTLTVTMRKAL